MSTYWITAISLLFTQATLLAALLIMFWRGKHQLELSPFWKTFQTGVVKQLHHPHPESKEMDELLEKLEALTITREERKKLITMLRNIIKNPHSNEHGLANFLLLAMPEVARERGEPVTPPNGIPVHEMK